MYFSLNLLICFCLQNKKKTAASSWLQYVKHLKLFFERKKQQLKRLLLNSLMILYVLNFSVFGNYRVMLQKASKNAILYSKETELGLDSIMVNGQYSLLYFISKVYTKCDTIHRFNENILKCSRLLNFPSFENKSIEHTWKKMMGIYLFKGNLIAIIILNIGIPNVYLNSTKVTYLDNQLGFCKFVHLLSHLNPVAHMLTHQTLVMDVCMHEILCVLHYHNSHYMVST